MLKFYTLILFIGVVIFSCQNNTPQPNAVQPSIIENFVEVKGGQFLMGAADTVIVKDQDEKEHPVELSDYWIMDKTVSRAQWNAIMKPGSVASEEDQKMPVAGITWDSIQTFIDKLNANGEWIYSLPTEAQWEYAARGGQKSRGTVYSGSNHIDEVGWYSGNSNNRIHSSGELKPNELGIYDMTGNQWEWCQDWYGEYPSDTAVTVNPSGPANGAVKVLRGGSWYSIASLCRNTLRSGGEPSVKDKHYGFRLVRIKK
jgi:formylglycine-generating enzyme required for sulfatase activity